MRNWFYIITVLSVLLLACNSSDKPQVKEDAKEYFLKANKSSLEVKDATYKVNFVFKSNKDDFKTTIYVTLLRDPSVKLGFVAHFKTDDGEGLYTGDKYYYTSNKEKKMYFSGDDAKAEMFLTQNWIMSPISMIMLDRDYSNEINKRTDELFIIGDAKFDKYDAMVVESILRQDTNSISTVRTYFDKQTNLPIKELKTMKSTTENFVQTFEILDLKINQGVDKAIFTPKTPEGYVNEEIVMQGNQESDDIGKTAEDFTLTDVNGKSVSLSSLKGNVVVLDFWGTWCHWCVKAMPKLQNVHEHFKGKNVVVLGISCNEREGANPKAFMKENKVTYNSLLLGNEVANKYNVTGFPTLFVIDKNGKIISSKSGFSDDMDKDLIELITKNL